MFRATLTVILVVAGLSGGALSSPALCTCPAAKEAHGWCDAHAKGYVASLEIRSKLLYDTLDAHGHTLDPGTLDCDACAKAYASDGFCAEHKIGFVGRQAYFSRLTYELTRGEKTDPATIVCPECRKNAESHGWCGKCGVGMTGNVAIRNRQAFDHAARSIEILRTAIQTAERCEYCAVAMVTDTRCHRCRIAYKDGRPLTPPTPAPVP